MSSIIIHEDRFITKKNVNVPRSITFKLNYVQSSNHVNGSF